MVDNKKKRELSPEHKEKLRIGREKALLRKKAEQAAKTLTNSDDNNTVQTIQPSQKAEDKATTRPRRIPLAEARNVMTVDNIPKGYVGRWVNDEKDRISQHIERGYVHAFDDPSGRRVSLEVGETKVDAQRRPGSVVSKVVQINPTGPLVAYLMLQREEWYKEDQAFKQNEVDKVAEQIALTAKESGLEQFSK